MTVETTAKTGYGTVASHLGLPDAGIATYTDMVSRVAVIAGGSKTPLIADGDTGYGGLLNVQYTVRGYQTEPSGNLYAFFLERSLSLARLNGYVGMIVPVSSVCTGAAAAAGSGGGGRRRSSSTSPFSSAIRPWARSRSPTGHRPWNCRKQRWDTTGRTPPTSPTTS